MTAIILVLAAYLAGSIPSGYWLVRVLRRVDIRSFGSGNIGATNVWRTFGARYGLPVAAFDVLKGFVPTLVATVYAGHVAGALAGGAAMLGHWRPLFLAFAKGGKMVATCGGALFGLAPYVALLGAALWLVVFAAARYASLASILATLALPLLAVLIGEPWPVVAFAVAAAAAVLVLHRANLRRLRQGTESRFRLRGRRGGEVPAR